MKKALLFVAAGLVAAAATVRRRQAQSDTEQLWREATSDASG